MEKASGPSGSGHPSAEQRPAAPAVERLLEQLGWSGPWQLSRLKGGRNNRVYRLQTRAEPVLLKWYFRHRDDPRDRLGAEYGFCRFAWSHGVQDVPRPLACDPLARLALYEFIEGRPLRADELTACHVAAAADFVRRINAQADSPQAGQLPPASEACFSFRAHVGCLQRRLEPLRRIPEDSPVHREARRFVTGQLVPAWDHLVRRLQATAQRERIEWDGVLAPSDRLLSPSDFGFHNALMTAGDVLRFIDLEYAGWDDPARLVGDFFCQIEVPVARRHFADFSSSVAAAFARPAWHLTRMRMLLPLCRLRWCCIVLNDFLPSGRARRRFSGSAPLAERLAEPLAKARAILAQAAEDAAPLG